MQVVLNSTSAPHALTFRFRGEVVAQGQMRALSAVRDRIRRASVMSP